jgi:hypothetical protein
MQCFDDDQSFRLRRDTDHWRSEITAALKAGKTVVVWLLNVPCVAAATGEKNYSGTGRNRNVTRIVSTFDPYSVLPSNIGRVVRKGGARIRVAADLSALATYWHEFGKSAKFEAYIEGFKGTTLLQTSTGEMTVGGSMLFPGLSGTLFLLPPPGLDHPISARIDSLIAKASKTKSASDDDKKAARTAAAKKKAESIVVGEFITGIVGIDKAARSDRDITPPPKWLSASTRALSSEPPLISDLEQNAAAIGKLKAERAELTKKLAETQELKRLLYEKGHPLESAVLIALRLLGYKAETLEEEDSEFDAVMISPTGERLIGEAEGKDEKAINVDKLDQLDRNLKEDFARQPEEGAQYARGVLFGNAYRLLPPSDRAESFTTKCLLAAARSRISLVRTPDLFEAARYLQNNEDQNFAEMCRTAIERGGGNIIQFPPAPNRISGLA